MEKVNCNVSPVLSPRSCFGAFRVPCCFQTGWLPTRGEGKAVSVTQTGLPRARGPSGSVGCWCRPFGLRLAKVVGAKRNDRDV